MPHQLQSPELQAFAAGFPLTLLHGGLTVLFLILGAALYILLTPHREIALIRDGNVAAAMSLGGVLLGLAIPLAILAVFSIKSYQYATTWHSNVTLWENALRQDPDNGVAYTDLAHYYIEKEDYATAIPLLKKAIENEATFVECFNAYQNLGVACSRTGHDDEAVKNFTSALSRRPAYVDALMNRGLSYTSMGKYDSAAADFTTILKTMDSLNVKAWYSRGIAWNKMNMPDRAIADYNTAIRINPGFQGPRVNRGNISFMRNQFDAAIADYNVALQLDPADGATFLNRSFSYFKLGRYTEALRDAMKAKELKTAVNPNYINDLEKGARR